MPSGLFDCSDRDEEAFVEINSNGRYGRYDEVLGSGLMKVVYRAFDQEEGIEVAWNKVEFWNLDEESVKRLQSEIYLLKSLRHENVLMLHHAWYDASSVNFITEACTSGTLREYRQKHRHVSMKALKNWGRQILEGLEYLHSYNPCIIHRDLNCNNIFVNGNTGTLKIADLGFATTLAREQSAHTIIGRAEFMAPEVYDECYNHLVDIYSFGMCMLELVTLEIPYKECNNISQIYKRVRSGEKPLALTKVVDSDVRLFIEKCLASSSVRPSASTLLLDPFFIGSQSKAEILYYLD